MNRIKNIVSFLYPIMIDAQNGRVTPYLEVMNHKGKYILNSLKTNYSFGELHIIFDELFQKIDIKKYDFKNVLILGMGAGSIISLLREEYAINCSITAIEKDEIVIELAKKYFNIEKFKSLTILNADAFEFTRTTMNKYDLIISDLFVDDNVPKKFASDEYLINLKRISNEGSCLIYNKLTRLLIHKKEFMDLSVNFKRIFPFSKIYTRQVAESESSILYNNTLPISLQGPSVAKIVNANQEIETLNLNPSYVYGTFNKHK